jgi:hypothetical protein
MSVARSVAEVLRDHVRLEVEAIDRIGIFAQHQLGSGAGTPAA